MCQNRQLKRNLKHISKVSKKRYPRKCQPPSWNVSILLMKVLPFIVPWICEPNYNASTRTGLHVSYTARLRLAHPGQEQPTYGVGIALIRLQLCLYRSFPAMTMSADFLSATASSVLRTAHVHTRGNINLSLGREL